MKHKDWNKNLLDQFMVIFQKWNMIEPNGKLDEIINNKGIWIINPTIKENMLIPNRHIHPQRIIQMLDEGLESKWVEQIERSNNTVAKNVKNDEFNSGKNWLATHDMGTGQPLDPKLNQ